MTGKEIAARSYRGMGPFSSQKGAGVVGLDARQTHRGSGMRAFRTGFVYSNSSQMSRPRFNPVPKTNGSAKQRRSLRPAPPTSVRRLAEARSLLAGGSREQFPFPNFYFLSSHQDPSDAGRIPDHARHNPKPRPRAMRTSLAGARMLQDIPAVGAALTDSHDADPNVAPMHHDIRTQFAAAQMAIVAGLGAVAIIAGIVFGLLLAND